CWPRASMTPHNGGAYERFDARGLWGVARGRHDGLRSERNAADDVRRTAVRAKRRGLALRKRDLLARFAEQPWPLTERRWLAHGDDANGAGSVEHSQWYGNAALEMGPWGNPGPYFFLRSGS